VRSRSRRVPSSLFSLRARHFLTISLSVMNRRSLSITALCLLLGVGYWFADRPAGSDASEEGVHRTPYDAQATIQTVSFWEKELAGDSTGGAKEANRLATAYLALQREKGRVAYARKAEEAARRWRCSRRTTAP